MNNDGSISLHIRSDKFGKLSNGVLVEVEHSLIKQHTKHIIDLSLGVKIVLAMNGSVWLEPKDITATSVDQIARLKAILELLNQHFIGIHADLILELYKISQNYEVSKINSQGCRADMLGFVAQQINKDNIDNISQIIRPKNMQIIEEEDTYHQ